MGDAIIRHDEVRQRFELVVEGHVCELDYRQSQGVMSILHTGVPEAISGRGLAGRLVERAFEEARLRGWKVRPACSYAGDWVRRHPEVADLLA